MLDVGKSWKPAALAAEGENMSWTGSLSEGPAVFRSPHKSLKVTMKIQICTSLALSTSAPTCLHIHQLWEGSFRKKGTKTKKWLGDFTSMLGWHGLEVLEFLLKGLHTTWAMQIEHDGKQIMDSLYKILLQNSLVIISPLRLWFLLCAFLRNVGWSFYIS